MDKYGALSPTSTERHARNPLPLDRMEPLEFVKAVHKADQEALHAMDRTLPQVALAIGVIAERVRLGGRLFYLGAGTSGRLGVLDAAECPPTFNTAPDLVQGIIAGGERALRSAVEGAEDDADQAVIDLSRRGFCLKDTLVGIAASGRTPYVMGGISYAKTLGAWTIALICDPNSTIGAEADIELCVDTGPEVLTGSTRMKAGTATKLILNMLSTGVMVRLGHVYDDLMVNVQPTNRKLAARANRIVGELAGLSEMDAGHLLEHAGSVKVAILMARLKLSRSEAQASLEKAGGRLRAALGE